jgi:WD40 repeat protein
MDETIGIWELAKGEEICVLKEKGDSSCVHSLAWSPDGSLIASGSTDQVVRLWDFKQRELYLLLDGHSGAGTRSSFRPMAGKLCQDQTTNQSNSGRSDLERNI